MNNHNIGNYRFKSLHDILSYIRSCRPGQLQQPGIFRSQNKPSPIPIEVWAVVDGKSLKITDKTAIWFALVAVIEKELKNYPQTQRDVFILNKLGIDFNRTARYPIEDISKKLKLSSRTLYRWINKITESLELEYINKGFLPKREENDRT